METEDRNKIRNAVDALEPPEGAKERMLARVYEKAAAQGREEVQAAAAPQGKEEVQAVPAPRSFNKRVMRWALPVAACFVMVIAGVIIKNGRLPAEGPLASPGPGASEPAGALSGQQGSTQMVNPVVSMASAAEVEEKTGIALRIPAEASDIDYAVINGELAQVKFEYGEYAYCLRASKSDEDFSGLYGEVASEEELDGAKLETIDVAGSLWQRLSWSEGDVRFIMSGEAGESGPIRQLYDIIKGL